MKHFSIITLLSLLSLAGYSQTTVKCQFQNRYWVVDYEAPLTQVDQGMHLCYPDKDWEYMDVEEFNQRVRTYLEEKTAVMLDEEPLALMHVSLEVNSAKVKAKYISKRFEMLPQTVTVRCALLEEIEGHESRLVLSDGTQKRSEALNATNAFEVKVELPLPAE